MYYDIGSVSNRNLQLLYEYRILRQTADNLTAICRTQVPEVISELTWSYSDADIELYDDIYECHLPVSPVPDSVPFLEFHPKRGTDWKWIADFIGIEVTDVDIILYSTTDYLTNLDISIHWCYSLRYIDTFLTDVWQQLENLADDYDRLSAEITKFKDTNTYLKRPEGLIPNLVKIQNTDESQLTDSGYRIVQANSNRLFVNSSQSMLDTMDHIFNDSVEFRFQTADHYVLDNFIVPVLVISGTGDLVLKNIKGQILLHNWTGTVTIIDCPDVHLTARSELDICKLSKLQISRHSTLYLENQVHQIDSIEMNANCVCRHWRANVKNLSYVGPGCIYWCSAQVSVPGRVQLDEYREDSNTVFDFNVHDIIGMFISDFNDILIVSQSNLTPRLGNSDAEPDPGMYVPHWRAEYTRIISAN